MEVTTLNPTQIVVRDRARRDLARDTTDRLKESISVIGLKTPLSVRRAAEGGGWVLVTGRHRLQACIELGWTEVPVREETGSERDARMWEIAENLHRSELTWLERSEHIAEWIRLSGVRSEKPAEPKQESAVPRLGPSIEQRLAEYGARSVLAEYGARSVGGRGRQGGISAAARELGIDRAEASRAVTVASLAPEAKAAAQTLGLSNNRSALLEAARSPDPGASLRDYVATKTATAQRPRPEERLERAVQLFRDARGQFTDLPLATRVAAARSLLSSLGVTQADLRPIS